jgi:hypothetical protein
MPYRCRRQPTLPLQRQNLSLIQLPSDGVDAELLLSAHGKHTAYYLSLPARFPFPLGNA